LGVVALFTNTADKAATAVTPAIIAPMEDGFREDIYILNIIFPPIIILNPSKKKQIQTIHSRIPTMPFHWKREMSVERRND
jgi:hypothetical protein